MELGAASSILFAAPVVIVCACFEHARRRALTFERRLFVLRDRDFRFAARALIAASRDSPQAVIRILDGLVRSMAPEADAFLFLHRDASALICNYTSGIRTEHFLHARIALDDLRSPISLAAAQLCRIRPGRGVEETVPGDRAFLAVPLVNGVSVVAVFYVASTVVDAFSAEEMIVTIADIALPAYQLAGEHLLERRHATVDALTGLVAPRAFRAMLADHLARAQNTEGRTLAVLFIDTDNFKWCNDTFGHAAGDVVLQSLARIFTTFAGPNAIVARNGGDEFCIVLDPCSKSEAIRKAENIRRHVASFRYPPLEQVGDVAGCRITASIGVCEYPSDAATASQLLERADAAMYVSKQRGRNRVSFYSSAVEIIDIGDRHDECPGTTPSSSR